MSIKSQKLILPLIIASLVGCGGKSSTTSDASKAETINEDQSLIVNLNYNVLNFSVLEQPKNGTVSFDAVNDVLTYTPNLNYNGTDSFAVSYSNNDKKENFSYDITINPVNDAPVILTENVIVRPYHNINDSWEYQLKLEDVEDEGFFYDSNQAEDNKGKSLVNLEFNNLELDEGADLNSPTLKYGEFSYNRSTRTITHVTSKDKEDYEQTAVITLADSNGVEVKKDITIKIDYVNEKPEYNGELVYTIQEGEELKINTSETVTDSDGDDVTVSIDSTGLTGTAVYADGEITYTPQANFFGKEEFDVTFTDEASESITERMVVNVTRTIDPLIVPNFTATIDEDTAHDLNITYTDQEGIPTEDIKFAIKSNPTKGKINLSSTGAVRYVPFENENGVDSFEITVYDNVGRSVDSKVDITINPINDPINLVSNIEYNTLGNIHFSGNLRSFVEDVDGDEIRFVSDSYSAGGATLEVTANGDIKFTPPVGEKNKLYNFSVGVTDTHLLRNINVSVLVEDRLIKIFDLAATSSSNVGTAENPYTNIDDAFTNLSSEDELYFCSNEVTLANNIEIPSNVKVIGFDSANKHAFVQYCQVENGTGTRLTVQDGVEITINSDLLLEGVKINNLSASDVVITADANLNNIDLKNLNITQVVPTGSFMSLTNVENLSVSNSIFYNGEKAITLGKAGQSLELNDVVVEDILSPLVVNEIDSNTTITIRDSEFVNFDKGLELKNTNSYTDVNFLFDNLTMNSNVADSNAINLNVNDSRTTNVVISNSTIKADIPLAMASTGSDGIVFDVLNNDLMTQKQWGLFINNVDAGIIGINVDKNDIDVAADLDAAIRDTHITIGMNGQNLISELNLKITDNKLHNTGNYVINTSATTKMVGININADTAPVKSVIDVKDNIFTPTSIAHLNIFFDDSNLANQTDINFVNNDFERSNGNSIAITEKNLVTSCLNLENNKINLLDLINNDAPTSVIALYDPLNEKDVSVFNRQTSINGYLPVQDYNFTFNACETNL